MSAWPNTRVDRVATVKARIGWKALTADEYQDDGYVFLNTPNIKGSEIDFDDVNYISQFRWDESPELQLRPGDVLLAKDGSTLGITQVVRDLPRPATVNGSIAVIRPHSMESRFLRYVLAAVPTQSRIDELRAGMGVPHLFQWDINRLPLPEPSIEEQRRISDFLDEQTACIDAAITKRDEQAELLSELRVSIISSLVKGESNSYFPTTKLRYLARLITGLTYSPDDICGPERGTALLRSGNVQDSRVVLDDLVHVDSEIPSDLLLRAGDILMCSRNGSARLLGKNAVITQDYRGFTFGAFMTVIRSEMPEWLSWVFRSDIFHAQLGKYATATINQLTLGMLTDLDVPLPSREVRDDVSTRLRLETGAIDGAHKALRASVELLGAYKRSLITFAVTGELDVTTARPEVPA